MKNRNGGLWVICGKCGSGDVSYSRGEIEEDGGDSSSIICGDCGEMHILEELNQK